MSTPKAPASALVGGAAMLLAIAAGCGEGRTAASRSAAAYDEAQRKGEAPTSTEGHHEHGEAPATAARPGGPHGDHASPEGADRPQAHGMDHGPKRDGAAPGTAVDHEQHAGTAAAPKGHAGMAAMDHQHEQRLPAAQAPAHAEHAPQAGQQPQAMDHSRMGHAATAQPHGAPLPPPSPEPASAVASPGQASATLRTDAIDGPVPTSVGDAARSAAVAAEAAAGGHGMSHGTYTQTDAGRDSHAPPSGAGHEGHEAAPQPKPSPGADPHRMHAPPSPRPSPSPRIEEDRR